MLVDAGTLDRLITTAFSGISSSVAVYVPHGRPQPTGLDVPWFSHRLVVTGQPKIINSSQPDMANIAVFISMMCPGEALQANAYILGGALTTASGLLCYQRFVDSPATHQLDFQGYEITTNYAISTGSEGIASLLVAGSSTISGIACRTV